MQNKSSFPLRLRASYITRLQSKVFSSFHSLLLILCCEMKLQVPMISSSLNLYAEYIMRNAGLEEAQAGIKIEGRNINNLRYVDDTTLWQKLKKN